MRLEEIRKLIEPPSPRIGMIYFPRDIALKLLAVAEAAKIRNPLGEDQYYKMAAAVEALENALIALEKDEAYRAAIRGDMVSLSCEYKEPDGYLELQKTLPGWKKE